MASFSISPAVIVNEIDATATVPAIYGQRGAMAGVFAWGPVGTPTLITSENELVTVYGKPSNLNAETFFTAADFLSYSNGIYINRANNGANTATGSSSFNAKYPGALGNALGVSYVTTNGYQAVLAGVGAASGTMTFGAKTQDITTATSIYNRLQVGDEIRVGNDSVGYQTLKIASLVDGGQDSGTLLYTTTVTFERSYAVAETDASTLSFTRLWRFHNTAGRAPDTGRAHIVVFDKTGAITGTAGTPVETFIGVSLNQNDKADSGESIYYRNVIEKSSWITTTSSIIVPNDTTNNVDFTGGSDGSNEGAVSFGAVALAYDPFRNAETYNVAFVLQGKAIGGANRSGLANYITENIVEIRKDCRAFLSPSKEAVVDPLTDSDKVNEIRLFRTSVNSSSYWHMDSGYKYTYDKYNDVFRWVPLNGACAGSYSRVDPWDVGAGYEKGIIKNVHKLAFNPNKEYRDSLYAMDINPVFTETGFGTILFGDKTGMGLGSAFSRQNVRGLFIYLEKEIANAVKILFFQFNDAFTQTRFKNMVEPKLRMVQGRRGLTDFRVVSDGTVNTADVIDSNTFAGKIFIKPSRTINYIVLDFIATPTGVEFDEIIGQV